MKTLRNDIRRKDLIKKDHKDGFIRPCIEGLRLLEFMEKQNENDIRAQERDERSISEGQDEKPLASSKQPAVRFDFQECSPYAYPLDGQRYQDPKGMGPTGMCPLCNNAKHREIDEFFLRNLDNPRAWGAYSFTKKQILNHMIRHIGLIYAEACGVTESLKNSEVAPRLRQALSSPGRSDLTRTIRVNVKNQLATLRADEAKSSIEKEETVADTIWLDLPPDAVYDGHISPSIEGRPAHAKAKDWYAFDGSEQQGALRLWGDKRMNTEIEKRSEDALVLYDEMLDVRRMARRIYSDIMDNEGPEPEKTAKGNVKYKERNYGAAISAVRLIKDTAMDLAKLALVTMKYGDESGKVRRLTPGMQSMLDDIGIFDKGSKAGPIEDAKVVPTSERADSGDSLRDEFEREFLSPSGNTPSQEEGMEWER